MPSPKSSATPMPQPAKVKPASVTSTPTSVLPRRSLLHMALRDPHLAHSIAKKPALVGLDLTRSRIEITRYRE